MAFPPFEQYQLYVIKFCLYKCEVRGHPERISNILVGRQVCINQICSDMGRQVGQPKSETENFVFRCIQMNCQGRFSNKIFLNLSKQKSKDTIKVHGCFCNYKNLTLGYDENQIELCINCSVEGRGRGRFAKIRYSLLGRFSKIGYNQLLVGEQVEKGPKNQISFLDIPQEVFKRDEMY